MLADFFKHELSSPLQVAESQRLRTARTEGALDLDALPPTTLFVGHADLYLLS